MGVETSGMVNRENDPETGKFTTKYDDEQFIDALEGAGGMATTREVAEAVGCPHRTAHYRLRKLRDEGRVGSKEVGAATLWLRDEDADG